MLPGLIFANFFMHAFKFSMHLHIFAIVIFAIFTVFKLNILHGDTLLHLQEKCFLFYLHHIYVNQFKYLPIAMASTSTLSLIFIILRRCLLRYTVCSSIISWKSPLSLWGPHRFCAIYSKNLLCISLFLLINIRKLRQNSSRRTSSIIAALECPVVPSILYFNHTVAQEKPAVNVYFIIYIYI